MSRASTTSLMKKYKYAEVDLNIRYYKFRAFVGKTGRLICIRAGCRHWKSFTEAFEHYAGEGDISKRWSNAWIGLSRAEGRHLNWAKREEARAALSNLRGKTAVLIEKIKARAKISRRRK